MTPQSFRDCGRRHIAAAVQGRRAREATPADGGPEADRARTGRRSLAGRTARPGRQKTRGPRGGPAPAQLVPLSSEEGRPSAMSGHKRSYRCFGAVPASREHAACSLPRIPQPDAAESADCYLRSERRRARAPEAPRRQASPPPPHDGHLRRRRPHRRSRRPGGADEPPPRAKRLVLVKNSEPSLRKTVVLHREGPRSFALFLEEVSELMRYHVRRLYTLDGHEVENVQSIIHCPNVLVCVGREPSHPSIVERFCKTAEDKLPKLSAKARSTGDDANQSTRHSVSSDKSLPDGTKSLDDVGSAPPTAGGTPDDDVEKLVRVNKDGSLSMKMKVRFRLDNNETLLWSTEVRKSSIRASEQPQGLGSDRSYSGSENFSTGEQVETYVTRRHQRRAEGYRYPHCYNIWANVASAQGDSCGVQTSSSSASSHTVVSRKTVVQRSSEENAEQVAEQETCVKASETVEYCTIRPGSCTLGNYEQKEPESAVNGDNASLSATRPPLQTRTPQHEEATESAGPRKSSSASSDTKRCRKMKKSKKSYTCHCGISKDDTEMNQEETDKIERQQSAMSVKSNVTHNAEREGEEEEGSKSAMSALSNASPKCEPDVLVGDERPPSHMSVRSEVQSEQCQSKKEAAEERPQTSLSSKSKTSVSSQGSAHVGEEKGLEEHAKEKDVADQSESRRGQRTQSQTSVSKTPKQSVSDQSEADSQGESKMTGDAQERASRVRSSVSNVTGGTQERSASAVSAPSPKSKTSEVDDTDAMSESNSYHVDGCTRDIPVERVSSSRSLVSTTSDVRSRQSKTPDSGAGGDTTEAAEDRPQSAAPSVNLTRSCQSKSSEDDDGVVDDEWKIGAASNMSCHLEGKENFPYDEMEETPSSDQVEGNPGNRCESKARSQSGMSGKAVKSESSTISFTSKASEQQNGSIEELTEGAESVASAKSKASKRSDKVEATQDEVTGEKANQRSPSIMSTKSAEWSVCSRSNEDESELSVKSERSATSAKSMRSIKSSASKPGDVPAESKNLSTESNIPEAPMNGVDTNERAMSAMSVQSHISTRSGKSKCSADAPAEDKSHCSDDEKNELTEERASSCASAKSIESHVSAERSPSALSATSAESRKSSKSNTSEMSAGKNIADEDVGEERDERAQSATSAKTAKSTLSLRSTASKGAANARDREERAHSSRSVRSQRSAKSNISATAVSVNDVVSDHGADSPLDEQSESISISSLSVQSSKSDRSSRSQRTAEVRRPKSNPSDTSEVSEVVPEDVSSRTGSKLSAKSDKSSQSKVSTEENGSCHDPVERASSNLSIRSGKFASVSVASRDGSEFMSEHSIEIAEIETSVASDTFARSNESKLDGPAEEISERADDDKDQEQQQPEESPVQSQASGVVEDVSENCVTSERAASSLSAKSALSASSKKSKTSALSPLYKANEMESENQDEFAERSASKASVETTRTNVSESLRSAGACEVPSEENAANEEETTPRPLSAVSAKSSASAKSAQSISSAKSKSSIAVGENNDDSIDRAPSSTFGKSTESRRSNSSAASTKSKAVGDVFNTDDTEGRAKSVVSLLSGASKTSQRPQTECGEEECEEERAMTNKSDTSLKSTTSNVSDRRGDEGIRGTSGALSVKSYQSSRSRTSGKISCEPSEGTDERTKSAMSNVSAKSKKSDVPVVAVEECEHRASTAMSSKSKSSATSEVLGKKSKASAKSTQSVKSKKIGILVDEDDDSQTKPISQICETLAKRDVSSEQVPNGPKDAVAVGRSDHKSDKETMHADDGALVPSSLPNASLSEVVNEWLNKIPPDEELCDMEEFSGNAVHETNADSAAENRIKGLNDESGVSDNECQKTAEKSKADNCGDTDSKIFHSSVQVMKVLLNPKLDRCNSLPEVSPVYGNKLSTSATGLFDCLAKLQLIDSDPKNADKKCERYKALIEILQSLWLCDPLEKKPVLEEKADRHSDKDFNPGSSSGIDVNSGSTGSQKSSDGRNKKQTLADTIGKAHKVHQDEEAGGEEEEHTHEENPKGDPSSDETIRGHDSPRGLCDSPPSSNKSSGTGQRLETDAICGSPVESSKELSHDPDPVWVLSLLTKIEKQFMTHYVNAVSEFKDQWNIDDNEQLDRMIIELRDEIHRRIQISIHRELCKIQGRAGLPRPPKEAKSRPSTAQTDGRRRRLRMKTKHSGKSDDSTASTIFSDQRGENEDENCPCESCLQKKMSRGPQIPAEIMNTAPVLLDFDLKRSLQMRNDEPKEDFMTNSETKAAAATLVGQILDHAIKEAVEDKVNDMEIVFEVSECERETDNKVDEAMMENDSSKEDGECAVSSEDADANAAEDEDEAKEPTVSDMSQDEPGGGGAVDMENETPATSADESDDASTVKDSNEGANTDDEVTAETAMMVEEAAEDAATAQEAVLAATSQQESEEDGGGGVDGEEEPPAASGDENDDPATTSKSNDDESPNDEEQDEEGPVIDTLEDEVVPQESTITASADDKTQEDEEGAGDGEENDHASPVKTSNEDANAEDEVFADDGEDEDAALEVATGATSEHVSEANEEGAGEDEEGTPATCGDDDAANEMASEEVPETTEDEDATQQAAVMATSEQESDEDEEGGVDGQAQTPDTSGAENEEAVAENQDAAEAEMRSEEVSETAKDEDAAQKTATGKGEFEPGGERDVVNGEEETPATSGAENEDAADTDQDAEEDVAETTTVEDAVSATSERQSEEEEEGNVDSEEETPGRSGAENRDATAEDQDAANDGGMTSKEVPDAEEAATSEPESEEDKEQKVSGEEETLATSGDENNRYVDDGVAAKEEKMSDEATATAAAEDDDAAVSAQSERESEEDDKVDGEEETPATSGDENDGTASKDDDDAATENDQTNAASEVAAEDDNAAQEATVTATSDDESVNETADGDHDMSVTSGDDIEDAKDETATEKDLPASSEDDSKVETAEEEESLHKQDGGGEEAGHEDEIIAPTDEEADDADGTSTYKQDSEKAEEEQGTLSADDSGDDEALEKYADEAEEDPDASTGEDKSTADNNAEGADEELVEAGTDKTAGVQHARESHEDNGEDYEHSVEEDPALTSDGGEDPEKDEVRAMSDEDTSKKDDITGNTSKQEEESENEEPQAESEEPEEKDDQEATGGGSTDTAVEGCDEEEDGSNEAQVAKNDPGGAPQEDEARNGEGDVNEKSEVTKGRGPDDVSGADNERGDHDQDEDERKVDTLEASDKEEEEPELINAASLDHATDLGAENKEKSKMGHDDKEEEEEEEEPKVTEKEGPANVMALGAEDNETVDDQDEDDKETSKTENGERELTKNQGPDEAAELGNERQENKDADEEDQPQGDDEHDDKETHGETFEASEKEERGPESANQGESADAEDEAESLDGEDQEALSEAYDFIPGKAANWEADKSVAEEPTTLRGKTTLNKVSTESEDAVYADGEDSDA
ncbi:retinitis pigmentosa 1-like 1 protein [Phycodurus eques]|uniref:retinitis pigmentosa 1-like 1 protein n=1 Tax=Phycodurus eques TaxID=693459 RepID=UPI002ACD3D2F|nr:retinitis pigmentosa 1-like 1 protein [Phycodurus eques]